MIREMCMICRATMLLVALFYVCVNTALSKTMEWPYDELNIALPETMEQGQLDNGLRYLFYQTDVEKSRVSMRLYVNVGAIDEADNQSGFSHFVEHMGYQGTIHFVPGEVFDLFNKIGMRSGPEINAFTDIVSTVYHLELSNHPYWLNQGLTFFRDVSDGMLFPRSEFEKEKKVIKSEKRYRDDHNLRNYFNHIDLMYHPNTAKKFRAIGDSKVVDEASRVNIDHFYKKYYQPENMAIIVAGDFEKKVMREKIALYFKNFSGVKKKYSTESESSFKNINSISIHTDQSQIPHVFIYGAPQNRVKYANEKEYYQSGMAANIAALLINRRLNQLVNQNEEVFVSSGYSSVETLFDARLNSILLSQNTGQGKESISQIVKFIKQLLVHGISDEELIWGKQQYKLNTEQYFAEQKNVGPGAIANEIVQSIKKGSAYVGSDHFSAIYKNHIDKVTKRQVNQVFQLQWSLDKLSALVFVKEEGALDADQVKDIISNAVNGEVSEFQQLVETDYKFNGVQKSARIVEKKKHKVVDITELHYKSNVVVAYQKRQNTPQRVEISMKLGRGFEGLTEDTHGIDIVAKSLLLGGGVGSVSAEKIGQSLNEKGIQINLDSYPTYYLIQANVKSTDLEYVLGLLSGMIYEPNLTEVSLQAFHNRIDTFFDATKSSLSAMVYEENNILYPDLATRSFPDRNQLTKFSLSDVKSWMQREFIESKLRVAIVGDFDTDTLPEMVARTVAKLPKREKGKYKKIAFAGPKKSNYHLNVREYPAKDGKATLQLFWPLKAKAFTQSHIASYILARMLEKRLVNVVRDKIGASYVPYASTYLDSSIDSHFYLLASIDTSRQDYAHLYDVIRKEVQEFAERGISKADLESIKPQIYRSYRDSFTFYRTWTSFMLEIYDFPNVLEYTQSIDTYIKQVSAKQLSKLAKSALNADSAIGIAVIPEE